MSDFNIIVFLKNIGIETPIFIAGAAGSISILTKKRMTWFQKFITVLSGGLAANYLTPLVLHFLDLKGNVTYGVAFLVGYSGMGIVEVIILKLKLKNIKNLNVNINNNDDEETK
jgi:ABC-type nickel/cobalt efflux system permease component RcnA